MSSVDFAKCCRSEKFSNIFLEKNLHISEPTQFKFLLFKSPMYFLKVHNTTEVLLKFLFLMICLKVNKN